MGSLQINSKIIKRRRDTARQPRIESIRAQARYHCKKLYAAASGASESEGIVRLQGHEIISTSSQKSRGVGKLFFCSKKPESLHHSAANKIRQRKTTRLLLKDTVGRDPISLCAERVREPRPKQPTQEPTQASLTAEGIVGLVDFHTLLRSFRTCS